MNIWIVLPAFNEEEALPEILNHLTFLAIPSIHVIVVNDGSRDQTVKRVEKFSSAFHLEILHHSTNQGLGAALRTGFNHTIPKLTDEDAVIVMDSDGTHPTALIPEMLKWIRQDCDLVLASRFVPGGTEEGLPTHRLFLSHAANWLMRILFPIPGVLEYTCSFKAYKGKLLKKAYQYFGDKLIEEQGFTCMAELLIKSSFFQPRIVELPLRLRYDLKPGKSKMKISRTILRYFYLWAHLKKLQLTWCQR